MLNRAEIIGNLGADPRISTTKDGSSKVATFSVATTEKGYTTQSGRDVAEKTDWHSVVVFGRLAEIVEKYLKKGSKVYIAGKMRNGSYKDKDGVTRYTLEIHAESMEMLDGRQSSEAPAGNPPQQSSNDPLPF